MQRFFFAAVAAMGLLVSACSMDQNGAHFTGMSSGDKSTPGSYCYEHTAVCVAGGVIVAGTVTAIIVHNNRNDNNPPPPSPSDIRLKRDIHPLMLTENGIQLYTFRYAGDARLFSGVMAQDLLKDRKYAAAVSRDAKGFYHVDYAKLGLSLVNAAEMTAAGERAEASKI